MIGEKVKDLRLKLHMTQEELGEKIGVTGTYIRYIEKNQKMPSLKIIDALADYFKVSVAYLTDREENKVESSVIENFINKLIRAGIITDPYNVDKETENMIMVAVKTEIDRQIKEQNKKD